MDADNLSRCGSFASRLLGKEAYPAGGASILGETSPTGQVELQVPAPDAQRGLENNPGKDGKLINDTHPYFPENCNLCPFYKPKGVKNRIKAVFMNRKKDCCNCPYIDPKLPNKQWGNPNAQPPEVGTYKRTYNGQVLVSPYHGENELTDNKRLADFLVDKLKTKVYLLPRLEQTTEEGRRLRRLLLPDGVKEGKNPDFLINGLLFDGKSMYKLNRNANFKQQKNAIEHHIKKAKEQADHIVLEIPNFVERKTIHKVITNYLSRSKKERIILVHWKNKLLEYGGKTKR